MNRDQRLIGVVLLLILVGFSWVNAQPDAATQPTSTTSGDVRVTTPSTVEPDDPAVPTTEVPSPAEPEHSSESVQWGLAAVLLFEWAKKTKYFPWLKEHYDNSTLTVIGFIIAVATALSINISITGDFFGASGVDVTFAHVSWTAIKDVIWQWVAQQGWYLALVKRTMRLDADV